MIYSGSGSGYKFSALRIWIEIRKRRFNQPLIKKQYIEIYVELTKKKQTLDYFLYIFFISGSGSETNHSGFREKIRIQPDPDSQYCKEVPTCYHFAPQYDLRRSQRSSRFFCLILDLWTCDLAASSGSADPTQNILTCFGNLLC